MGSSLYKSIRPKTALHETSNKYTFRDAKDTEDWAEITGPLAASSCRWCVISLRKRRILCPLFKHHMFDELNSFGFTFSLGAARHSYQISNPNTEVGVLPSISHVAKLEQLTAHHQRFHILWKSRRSSAHDEFYPWFLVVNMPFMHVCFR